MEDDLKKLPWLPELVAEVRAEMERLGRSLTDQRPTLEREAKELDERLNGWAASLGRSNLAGAARELIESQMNDAVARKAEIEASLQMLDHRESQRRTLVDPRKVFIAVEKLLSTIASNNVTEINVELALHIDHIRCSPDGQITLRTCRLGALAGTVNEMNGLQNAIGAGENDKQSATTVVARRRSRRRVEDTEAAHWTADPRRFSGLDEKWFVEEKFEIPPPEPCWAEANAETVARRRADGLTHEQLSAEFGLSIPTIRKSLEIAAEKFPEILENVPRKMPRANWPEENYREVAAIRNENPNWTMKQLKVHFGKSEPWIRLALKLAEAAGCLAVDAQRSEPNDGNREAS